jgi:hypothetical protein
LGHVTLQQLQQHHDKRHTDNDEGQPASAAAAAADSYLDRLETDHAFASNHCVAAMAEQLGLSQYTDCLAGTLQATAGMLPNAADADAAMKAVRQQIDDAWSKEAVWRGVGFAKEGEQLQGVIISCSSVKAQPLQNACVGRMCAFAHANCSCGSCGASANRAPICLAPVSSTRCSSENTWLLAWLLRAAVIA